MRKTLSNVVKLIDSVTDKLSVPEAFLLDIKKSVEITDKKNQSKPSPTYKPSGMNCMRASYYQITGAEQDSSNASYILVGIAESGTDRHERIQQYITDMKSNGFDCEYVDVSTFIKQRGLDYLEVRSKTNYETKLYWKDMNLSFLCDGIIKYRGHYYILEIKTETQEKWFKRSGVDPNHYNQATAYSLAFNLPQVLFIYENRNTCDKKAYLFDITDDMRTGLIGYIANCDSYIESKIVPPKPLDSGPKFCQYCSYRKVCDKDGG